MIRAISATETFQIRNSKSEIQNKSQKTENDKTPSCPLLRDHKTFLQALPLCVVVTVVYGEAFACHHVHNDAKRQGL